MRKLTIDTNMFYNAKPNIFIKAKELRKNMTEAEKLLWSKLRVKQLNGYRFKKQHPIDIFIADFYCHEAKLIIEVDGLIHEYQKEYDIGREAELNELNLKILRYSNSEIINDVEKVINNIKHYLPLKENKKVSPLEEI